MLVAAVLCLCAAVAIAAISVWLLGVPRNSRHHALRAVAPTQLAAAVMLAAGGAVALSTRADTAFVVVIVCVVGAVSTVAAGCWQSAKAVARGEATAGCVGGCATCTLSSAECAAAERLSVPADVDRV